MFQDQTNQVFVAPVVRPALTLEDTTRAFAAWETALRLEPSKFMSAAECAALDVDDLSTRCAAHFCLRSTACFSWSMPSK